MRPFTRSFWRTALVSSGATLLIALALLTWFKSGHVEQSPADCAITPTAHHSGTFKHWRLSMGLGEGMPGEVSAVIVLPDGREIIAFNVTNAAGLRDGDTVTVAEIQCIHRRVFLIQSGGN